MRNKYWRLVLLTSFLGLLFTLAVKAQPKMDSIHVVQISGKVVTEENDQLVNVPYAVVAVAGTRRGTFTDVDGFFSIVVRNGETLAFTVMGFKDAYYKVPDTLSRDRYTLFQILTTDTILLPEAVIYPGPIRTTLSKNSWPWMSTVTWRIMLLRISRRRR